MAGRRHTHRARMALGFFACAALALTWPGQVGGADDQPEQDAGRERAMEVLGQVREAYASMRTYQSDWTLTAAVKHEGIDSDAEHEAHTGTVVFEGPNRVATASERERIVSDGGVIRLWSGMFRQYVEAPKPASQLFAALEHHASPGFIHATPILSVLLKEEGLCAVLPQEHEVVGSELVRNDDGSVWHIYANMRRAVVPTMNASAKATLHIEDGSWLIRRIEFDVTESLQQLIADREDIEDGFFAGVSIESAVFSHEYENIRIDEPVADDAFSFDAGDALKVNRFILPGMGADQHFTFIGKPAPEFSGKDFDDRPVRLSDLRGNVVVLDFWAMWSASCLQALPHLQSLSERFADLPVVFLGINQDDAESRQRAREFLAERGVTFRQFDDASQTVTSLYEVANIPCTVLIDAEGVVQDIVVSFGFGGETQLAESIERMLRGERLVDDEELALRRRIAEMDIEYSESDSAAKEAAPVERTAATPDLNADRLVDAEAPIPAVNSMQTVKTRVNGADAVLAPTVRPGQFVMIRAGAEPEQFVFEGIGSRHSVTSIAPFTLDGESVVAVASVRRIGGRMMTATLSVHDQTGRRLSEYIVERRGVESAGAYIDIADLTHDGVPEIVFGLSMMTYEKRGNGFTHQHESASIIVLDAHAQPIAASSAACMINFVRAVPGRSKNEPATILYGDWQSTRAMRFQP